ncbi:MAG TPA: family 1 encapsulin nanocompartment shell protein, partial [Polyangiales bacterium]
MDLLKRKLAPICNEAWEQIDDEARRVLKLNLAGRKLVDFSGPHGWHLGAVNTGRLKHIEGAPAEQVGHAIRDVRPLMELRTQIKLDTLELDYAGRGANDIDLDPIVTAAENVARAEDRAIFHGFKPAGITGIVEASPHNPIVVKASREWPRAISTAKEVLRRAGVDGPYALALGVPAYDAASSEDEGALP